MIHAYEQGRKFRPKEGTVIPDFARGPKEFTLKRRSASYCDAYLEFEEITGRFDETMFEYVPATVEFKILQINRTSDGWIVVASVISEGAEDELVQANSIPVDMLVNKKYVYDCLEWEYFKMKRLAKDASLVKVGDVLKG